MNCMISKPREYEGPLDTPDDFAFAEFMCRYAKSLTRPSKKREEEQEER